MGDAANDFGTGRGSVNHFSSTAFSLNLPPHLRARKATVSLRSAFPGEYGRLVNFYANPNQVQPPHPVAAWDVPTYVQNNGAIRTGASIAAIGRFKEQPNADGNYDVRDIGNLNYMVGSWGDVTHNYVSRGSDLPGSTLFHGQDRNGKDVISILEDGSVMMLDEVTSAPYRLTVRNGRLTLTAM
jgi:hypothetical protein